MTEPEVIGRYVLHVREIDADDPKEYGGKAVGLARMADAKIPIPPAVVIGTRSYRSFVANDGRIIDRIAKEIRDGIGRLEQETGKKFAGSMPPLLVSVRSGAAISMPGMMDTILNLGLNAQTALEFARSSGKPEFVLDTWTRFWRMYVETVLDLDGDELGEDIEEALEAGTNDPSARTFDALESAILSHIRKMGCEVSADPYDQLIETVAAVFRSWNSPRAKAYRKHHNIPDDLGTAVTIQAMVFGNADNNSGTGVAFTRDPNTGEKVLYGEYLTGHQGEDLVAGTHTPIKLTDAAMPKALVESLEAHGATLESLYRDAVDIEFTVESGTLYFLQVRAAKRTAAAAIKIATDLVQEGLVSEQEGIRRASLDQVLTLLKPSFDPEELAAAKLLAEGLGSSPGQSSGVAVLDSDRAADRAAGGEEVILLRPITSPQDIRGMLSSNGIVTARGGALSHAAVVSRALDKPCIVGCEGIAIDLEKRTFAIAGETFEEGTPISIDGGTGKVYAGIVPVTAMASSDEALANYLNLADRISGADIWSGLRSEAELQHGEFGEGGGFALIGLTDLVRAKDRLSDFSKAISLIARDESHDSQHVISEITAQATLPLLEKADGRPVHIRLPQLGSERARELLPNWEDLAAAQFLPLGNLPLLRALLSGISSAANKSNSAAVTVFSGGIATLSEFDAFQREVAVHTNLDAGLLVQNFAMLQALLGDGPRIGDAWLDVNEIIRTVHGLPAHLQQMSAVFEQYCGGDLPEMNPFCKLAAFLEEAFLQAGRIGGPRLGVLDGHALYDDLVRVLYEAGFRRFSTSLSGRNEARLKLAKNKSE